MTSPEGPKLPDAPNPGDPKLQLECEKLRAEIESIRRPFFRTPAFYVALSPVALAVIGVIFTWAAGWFDVQRTRLTNEKTLIEAQTERLKTERETLGAQAREQQTRITRAEGEIEKLRQRESSLTNEVAKLSREREDLRLAKELLEVETKRLAGSDTKASQFLDQLKSLQAAREKSLADLHTLQASNATLHAAAARQIALIRWANAVLFEGLDISFKDKATWGKFSAFREHAHDVQVASISCLPEWQIEPDTRAASDKRLAGTYGDDLREHTESLLWKALNKSYEDYIREAQEHYDLLNGIIRSSYDSNHNQNPAPPCDQTPSQKPPSP